MTNARDEILSRIQNANRNVPAATRDSGYQLLPRHYRQTSSLLRSEVIECFIDRLHDYGCNVYRCAVDSIAPTVAQVLQNLSIGTLLVSSGVPEHWRPAGIHFEEDHGLTYEEMNTRPGVLTGCAAAISLTGSIILSHRNERRALTLIPDYHLCVILENQITETVPEAIRQIAAFGNAPVTTIAGPSATADIEMTRIKGVHGPRFLDIILAGQ